MAEEKIVLDVREASSMSSCWNEYLCVTTSSPGVALLEVCRYEGLAEVPGEDEDGNEVPIPDMIDGVKVMGVEDGYLVGGELQCYEDEMHTTYTVKDLGKVKKLIEAWGFDTGPNVLALIKSAVT